MLIDINHHRPHHAELGRTVSCLVALLLQMACSKPSAPNRTMVDAGMANEPSAAPALASHPPPSAEPALVQPAVDPSLERKFRWTDEVPPHPCIVDGQVQPPGSSHADCVNAKKVERWMSVGGERELVGSPRSNHLGCGERPDLVLGTTYPNNGIFLLTPTGQRFPDVYRDFENDVDERTLRRKPPPRLRLRGRFAPQRGIYVDDPRVFSGDNLPCDREPHPVFLVEAWCVDTRGAKTFPQLADGKKVPNQHICGRPTPF